MYYSHGNVSTNCLYFRFLIKSIGTVKVKSVRDQISSHAFNDWKDFIVMAVVVNKVNDAKLKKKKKINGATLNEVSISYHTLTDSL